MSRELGLDKPARIALCDASYGLLACLQGRYRRQTSAFFLHASATIDRLVTLGLLEPLGNEVVGITPTGRRAANRIRANRAAIAAWDRRRAHSDGYHRAREARLG